jgi:hypothetical protein
MDIASVFEWFAQESMNVAEYAEEPRQREMLLRLGVDVGGRCATVPRRSTGDAIYLSIELIEAEGGLRRFLRLLELSRNLGDDD